ncbi:hypothetical protein ZHAS_00011575 [Anopheles sinensis]|uniref:Uncharacterized protein n=1 Tax=Anopheles sinensis TaxID=74873 RepID=A0A084W089_ANOSI|nr:hypothetical protein ZHAS_00011575 [Anopheles sinensis]
MYDIGGTERIGASLISTSHQRLDFRLFVGPIDGPIGVDLLSDALSKITTSRSRNSVASSPPCSRLLHRRLISPVPESCGAQLKPDDHKLTAEAIVTAAKAHLCGRVETTQQHQRETVSFCCRLATPPRPTSTRQLVVLERETIARPDEDPDSHVLSFAIALSD